MKLFRLPQTIIVSLIVSCSLFMEQLDGSIIATALPSIATSLKTEALHLNLAITTYLFGLAIFIPLSGWVADRWGARNVFCGALLVFTLSSAACGLADSLWGLVFGRFFQGLGGSMMLPIGRLLIMKTVKKHEVVDALAWIAIPSLVGPILGPPLGGFIVTYFSWRWIFLINLPIGLLGMWFAARHIDNYREKEKTPLDIKGFCILALALGGLVFAFETIGRGIFPRAVVGGLFGWGIAGLIFYALYARKSKDPLVDLTLFKSRCFAAATMGGGLFRIGVSSLPFLLPLLFQVGFGLSPLRSGLLSFASAIGSCSIKFVAGPLIRRLGFRSILVWMTAFSALVVAGCGLFTAATPHFLIFCMLVLGGWVWSLQFTALHAIAFADIKDAKMSRATTLFSMMQQLSRSLGVASASMILGIVLTVQGRETLLAQDFLWAFGGVGLMTLVSTGFFLRLRKEDGAEMIKKKVSISKTAAESASELTPDT